ncbi:beta-sandwich lipoprotein [Tsukamurella soli]|uniref:Uncharacterized protein n=1 Tax=Tsukamurella soli TaxID=644556 RepID=A0ABP8JJB3_9ACTN
MPDLKKTIAAVALAAGLLTLGACGQQASDAEVVSHNISNDADNFRIERRVVFYNGITDKYILEITGLCSTDDETTKVEVTCKVGDNKYLKHIEHLSDNVTYFSEQLEAVPENKYQYEVNFKPESILPDVELR